LRRRSFCFDNKRFGSLITFEHRDNNQWLLALDGELRFARDITLSLLRAGLVRWH
jgi:hypothetical protein